MMHTRWKLLAGFFGLSLCGLAALASASGKAGSSLGCDYHPINPMHRDTEVVAVIPVQPNITSQVVQKAGDSASKPPLTILPAIPVFAESVPPPIALGNQQPVELPKVGTDQLPPFAPDLAAPKAGPVPLPIPGEKTVVPIPTLQSTGLPMLPVVEPARLTASLPDLTIAPTQPNEPKSQAIVLPPLAPGQLVTPQAVPPVAILNPIVALPAPAIGDKSSIAPIALPAMNSATIPTVEVAKPASVAAKPSVPEIQLTIRMTGSTPSLELRSSNGSFITLNCEQLDIAARGPKEELPSSIKASGKVTFTSPGCKGTCDELVFNPKTMDGTLRNGVRVQCSNQGSVTELTADQIAFQLRSGDEMALSVQPVSR